MVRTDTVIPVKDGFYTADKINANQFIHGLNGLTYLKRVEYHQMIGYLVETKYYSIVTCPHQILKTQDGDIETQDLFIGDSVLTNDGYQTVTAVTLINQIDDFFNIITEDKTFKANGFILLN